MSDQRALFQGGDFDWTRLALLLNEQDDGTATVNEAFLNAEDRAFLDNLAKGRDCPRG